MAELSTELQEKVQEWLKWDQNPRTRAVIEDLVYTNDVKELQRIMLTRLLFGTAGLRGRMGAGYGQMNELVVVQTSQGLVRYLLEVEPGAAARGVVVGHDSRHNSHRFARLAAAAFLSAGVKVFLHGAICATPFVPFTVREKGAAAGVMVTASHNPKEDNGYKVYWTNSAQIIPPHDAGIQTHISANLEPWADVWSLADSLSSGAGHPLLSDPLADMEALYYRRLSDSMLSRELNQGTGIVFTVTAMHGVGHRFMEKGFAECGFAPFVAVEEQKEPDPDFPTVRFPNPEEGKSALDLSFATADRSGSTVILANDPDADRLAVAVKAEGQWTVLTGNQEAALFGWWAWQRHLTRNHGGVPPSDVYMVASTVSSKILRAIAAKEGFNFVETLTGFKWMCNKTVELQAANKTVLFAFEEAIGFMMGTEVLDKDGVSAGVLMAELALHLHKQGKTLLDQLNDVYKTYGYHVSCDSYYICHDPLRIQQIFQRIRNLEGSNKYPSSVSLPSSTPVAITAVRDLTTGFDSSTPDQRATLPTCPDAHMITFTFANGVVMTLRTSGTEPKIKYYSEMCATEDQGDWTQLQNELHTLAAAVVETLLQPALNGLQAKA